MKRIALIGLAILCIDLGNDCIRFRQAGDAAQGDEVIEVKAGYGHGHMHHSGRGHHYGWGRGRGHHYGWRHYHHH